MAQILRTEKLKIVNKIIGSDIVVSNNLTMFIEEKEWTVISLPHGGGKTTLYRAILDQINPVSGKVIYHNLDKIDAYDREKFIRKNITAVPEIPSIESNFTVRDWTSLQIELFRPSKYKSRLEEFIILLEKEKINPEKHLSQLTLLEMRKVEIAFSIVSDTILIMCDDIDVGLSKSDLENLGEFLEKFNKIKAILIFTSNAFWNKYAKKVIRDL